MKIFKYHIKPAHNEETVVALPVGARILTFQCNQGDIVFWAMFDEKMELLERRHFVTYFTGHSFTRQPREEYQATVQYNGSMPLVVHIFEVIS